jgi:predicted molibdopterin-dependent oxidoreductase YjgC
MHAGMSWERVEQLDGIQWPCPDEAHPGTLFLHERLWHVDDPEAQGPKAPFSVVEHSPPVDELSDEYPIRLTTGRRLEAFNTGVQTRAFSSPLARPETIDLSAGDADRLGLLEGEVARITSRRGSIEAPVHVSTAVRDGLAFMTFHFPDQVETNILTVDSYDPKSGTSEFKATAVRIERSDVAVGGGGGE